MFCAFWICDIFGKNLPWEYTSDKVLIKALISAESLLSLDWPCCVSKTWSLPLTVAVQFLAQWPALRHFLKVSLSIAFMSTWLTGAVSGKSTDLNVCNWSW